MSFWDDAFDALADPDSGLAESGTYLDGVGGTRELTGPWEEDDSPQIVDGQHGRRLVRSGVWQVPKSDDNGEFDKPLADGRDGVELLGVRWKIKGINETPASWHLVLESIEDQKIRRTQMSTRT